ncbi:MAG TPA: N-acyl homoserine lactonase family protein [Thermodesulfobacteriota bacterium]|nr:N-acyl homoserine lactonase family protein [Thermodesulfobacteriota bacterium]
MKLFSLHIGETKVPYGQFYGGLAGWTGLRGIWKFITDKSHYIIVPIHGYLIDHPKAGLILVDTGINWEQAHDHGRYYKGITHFVLDDDEYLLTREQELPEQVARSGYRCEDIRTVILTHLHEDHVGGLRYVPEARVVIAQKEWEALNMRAFGFIPIIYRPSIAAVKEWESVSFTSGPFHSFDTSQDLLGDGTIILLPTPGHDPGHMCVLLQMDGYEILITGDILYTLRHLAVDEVRAVLFGGKSLEQQQIDSIRRIRRLDKALPELVIVPGHDSTEYQHRLLEPFLADGVLSPDEREQIRNYKASLFDENGHLVPSAMPHFIPPAPGGKAGQAA